MAGRRKAKAVEAPASAYRIVFLGNPFMLNRIEHIMDEGVDAYAGESGSRNLELALRGLVQGAPISSIIGVEELVPQVRAAIKQLFQYRDEGRFEVKHGH